MQTLNTRSNYVENFCHGSCRLLLLASINQQISAILQCMPFYTLHYEIRYKLRTLRLVYIAYYSKKTTNSIFYHFVTLSI